MNRHYEAWIRQLQRSAQPSHAKVALDHVPLDVYAAHVLTARLKSSTNSEAHALARATLGKFVRTRNIENTRLAKKRRQTMTERARIVNIAARQRHVKAQRAARSLYNSTYRQSYFNASD